MELLQRAVADCPRFASGTYHSVFVAGSPWRRCCRSGGSLSQIYKWFVLQGIFGGLVAKSGGLLSQIRKWKCSL